MSQIVSTKTRSVDLSAFSNGDTCHLTGSSSIRASGANRAPVFINDYFVWSSDNTRSYTTTWTPTSTTYTFTYTITLTSSQMTETVVVDNNSYSYGGELGYNLSMYKSTNPWVKVSKAYKKVSGSWVEQSDLTTVFDPTKHYKKGN